MKRIALALAVLCSSCLQAERVPMDAAFEVPLPAAADREAFLAILGEEAGHGGYRVDAETADQLREREIWPLTMNAMVWGGPDGDEWIGSAMDGPDHPGLVWLSFSDGSEPARVTAFRDRTMRRVSRRWPRTMRLPITPSGGLPLREDMVRTASGYEIDPRQMAKYQREADLP